MDRYLVLGKHNKLIELEGEEYIYDSRLFVVTYDDKYVLFDKASGTDIASAKEKDAFQKNYVQISKVYEQILQCKLYNKNCKRFNKLRNSKEWNCGN